MTAQRRGRFFFVLAYVPMIIELMFLPPPVGAGNEIPCSKFASSFAQYLRFSDPEMSALELVPGKPKIVLKNWSEPEQVEINSLLLSSADKAKGLMELSASDTPLVLCRVDHLSRGDDAATANGYLLFCDSFFSRSNRRRILIHELVHSADFGGRICYSKAWARFANPKIRRARQHFARAPRLDNTAPWLSRCASRDLSEALAEYVSYYLCSENQYPNDPIVDKVYLPLVTPDQEQLKYTKSFHQGINFFYRRQFKDAIKAFKTAECIEPLAPKPHACIAQCYFYSNDSRGDYAESECAIRLFKKASVPESEFDMIPRS